MGSVVLIVGVVMMVIIHEAGHFLAAKFFKIKATEAFFGFGPRLWSMQRGETEYGVKAIPLGGYVRITGMNPFEEVAPEDEGRTYREKPFWQKSIVVLAGIGSHFVVAFILYVVVALVWGQPGVPTNEVATVAQVLITELSNEPDPLSLRISDDVVSIDGIPLAEASPVVDKPAGAITSVEFLRNGQLEMDTTTARVVVAPAYLAGVQPGDIITSLAGVPVDSWEVFVEVAHMYPGQSVAVEVERDGDKISFDSILAVRQLAGESVGFFGVVGVRLTERAGPIATLTDAGSNVAAAAVDSGRGLIELVRNVDSIVLAPFSGEEQALDAARPISVIGLARIAGPLQQALLLLAFVNVFVGVLNVVPLYPLDGGHFAVALYEKIVGRAADVRRLVPVAVVVFVFLIALGLLGVYLDIVDPLQLPAARS